MSGSSRKQGYLRRIMRQSKAFPNSHSPIARKRELQGKEAHCRGRRHGISRSVRNCNNGGRSRRMGHEALSGREGQGRLQSGGSPLPQLAAESRSNVFFSKYVARRPSWFAFAAPDGRNS